MADESLIQRTRQRARGIYQRANGATGGWLGTLRSALDSFLSARGTQASAAIAYYAMFSLFPLLMVLVVFLSFLAEPVTAQQAILELVNRLLPDVPGIATLITETFSSVYAARSSVGLIGLIALFWSASGAFTSLTFNIDLAWNEKRRPNALKARLVGILLVVIAFAAVLAALFLFTVAGIVAALPALFSFLGIDPELARLGTLRVLLLATTIVVYSALYRWIPQQRIPWRAAIIPGVLAGLATQLVNVGYSWYVGSGFAKYELVYGPLTTIIVLMFWFYLTVLVILVGAHLGAAIARRMDGDRDNTVG